MKLRALVHDPDLRADIWNRQIAKLQTEKMMKVGVRRGRIIVIRPEDDHGPPGYRPRSPRTYVYRRTGQPCRLCDTPIRAALMEGRNLFWCPGCQV
jgi:endonuclease-8